MRNVLIGLVAIFLVACGNDSKNGTENTADNNRPANSEVPDFGGDVSPDMVEDLSPDADPDPIEPDDCLSQIDFTQTLTIDDENRAGQLYSTAAFDGVGVWVAYAAPQSADNNDSGIFVTRIGCDGQIDVAPQMISLSDADARNYMPVIDSKSGRTVVAWIHQPNAGNPKFTHLQIFGRDGKAYFETPKDITPFLGEDVISETAWSPQISVGSDMFYHVSEVLGAEAQIVVQRVGFDGDVEDVFFAAEEKDVNQRYPSVTALSDGGAVVAWTREAAMLPEKSYFTRIAPGATSGSTPQPAQIMGGANPLSALSTNVTQSGAVFLAFQSTGTNNSEILVRDVSSGATALNAVFGESNFINFRANVRAGAQGGAVAWYRYTTSPQRNGVVVQGFSHINGVFTPGEPVVVLNEARAIPPYGPGLTPVLSDVWFVTWTEGDTAPESRVRGQFVRTGGL